MKRRAILTAAISAAVALYAAISLWPYEWQVRSWIVNGAKPLPDGGVRFVTPGIAFTKVAPAWVQSAMRSQRLEILLQVRSFVPEQFGPARILTLSSNPYERNLTIGQQGADLILRLRTTWTDANGTVHGEPVARVPGLFCTDNWVILRTIIEPGSLRVVVGGDLVIEVALPTRPLEPWNPSYRLAVGNELTGNRPWLGEIGRVVVRVGRNSENRVELSELVFPPIGLFGRREGNPKLVPLRDLSPHDAIENVLLYVPLGLLLGLLLRDWRTARRAHLVLGALLLVAAVSASMEVLQVFVPLRAPSVDDVIFNTLGGGLGSMLALWAQPRLGAALRR